MHACGCNTRYWEAFELQKFNFDFEDFLGCLHSRVGILLFLRHCPVLTSINIQLNAAQHKKHVTHIKWLTEKQSAKLWQFHTYRRRVQTFLRGHKEESQLLSLTAVSLHRVIKSLPCLTRLPGIYITPRSSSSGAKSFLLNLQGCKTCFQNLADKKNSQIVHLSYSLYPFPIILILRMAARAPWWKYFYCTLSKHC